MVLWCTDVLYCRPDRDRFVRSRDRLTNCVRANRLKAKGQPLSTLSILISSARLRPFIDCCIRPRLVVENEQVLGSIQQGLRVYVKVRI